MFSGTEMFPSFYGPTKKWHWTRPSPQAQFARIIIFRFESLQGRINRDVEAEFTMFQLLHFAKGCLFAPKVGGKAPILLLTCGPTPFFFQPVCYLLWKLRGKPSLHLSFFSWTVRCQILERFSPKTTEIWHVRAHRIFVALVSNSQTTSKRKGYATGTGMNVTNYAEN